MITRSGYPLYLQLKSLLLEKIEAGEWAPGAMIPTELELTEAHGISRTTVRQAIQDLVASGILIRQQGRGTFVAAKHMSNSTSMLYGFLEELQLTGRELTMAEQSATTIPCPIEPGLILHLAPGSPVLRIRRRVMEDGIIIYADDCYIPDDLVRPHGIPESRITERVYQTLEAHGIVISSGDQTISAEVATAEEAAAFACSPGDPLLRIDRITRDGSGSPIEYTIARYRADAYAYKVRLMRSPSP
ncbi:MAG: GntR family transcriptional regulator [Firmicutes bacterium]|nr:GntR family transcriptional regulator [Bacillota bacterium]